MGRVSPRQFVINPVCNATRILPDVTVEKPQRIKAQRLERAITSCVLFMAMGFAVDLDHKLRAMGEEINDPAINRGLPPEMKRLEAFGPQNGPEQPFCGRHIAPELAGPENLGARSH